MSPVGTERDPAPPGTPGAAGDVIARISQDLSTLVRQELALARAEVTESAHRAGRGAGLLGGSGVAGQLALLFLSLTGLFLLDGLLGSLAWSALVVAAVWAVVALVLLRSGRQQLSAINGMPLTVETAKQVPGALTGNEDPS